jgi:two-component system nitrogen regulation response regulator NtrX
MAKDILIVDDEADIRHLIQGILEDEGYTTRQAGTAKQAFEQITERVPSLVILDVWLQNSEFDGLAILEQVKVDHPYLPVIMISGHGTIETAVTALKQGAYDFIEKPFKADRLLMMIDRALETTQLRIENQDLKKKSDNPFTLSGTSQASQQLQSILDRVALTNSRVLLTGESGAGKEITARTIHKKSGRANNPFILINCATINPQRMEQELFGYEENGLVHTGVLERAHTGTLLLDEVADMPLETQSKIVRVLQDQTFMRVGSSEHIKVDVRIIASTSRDLRAAMNDNKFREDLYYRLNVVPVAIPPLRQRLEDVPHLIDSFMDQLGQQNALPKREFSPSAMLALQSYNWPGNVRQLKNLVEWLLIMGSKQQGGLVEVEDLPPEISGTIPSTLKTEWGADLIGLPLREAREVFEREYLLSQVQRFSGNISKTAQFIGMERSALHRKLKSLNINTGEKDDEPQVTVTDLKKTA